MTKKIKKYSIFLVFKIKGLLLQRLQKKGTVLCENSSVVEHNLAKVGVAGSNPVSRSQLRKGKRFLFFLFILLDRIPIY